MTNDALRDIVTRFLGWLDETRDDDYMDTGVVLEYAQEMRVALTPPPMRSTLTHRPDFTKCEVPAVCRMYSTRLNRYVQFDTQTGHGVVYYNDESGKPTKERPLHFTGSRQYVEYRRLWLRCMDECWEWPEGLDG